MPDPIQTAGLFLVNTLFDLYIFVLMVRILLAAVHADFFNPLSQFIIKLTKFLIIPLRRVIPNFKNIELASVLMVLVLECIKFLLLGLIANNSINYFGLLVLAGADALKTLVNLFFYAVLLQAIMSWFNQGYSSISAILAKLTSPILRPFRRTIPSIGGIDISPLAVMIVLQLIIILFITPLFSLGWQMAFV
ncbi:MAG: YggT family protein [Pseudomonadota bacterium]